MNWDAIGAAGEIFGAIAVVVSLLYLATQVKQANRHSASDAGFALVSERNHLFEFVFTDAEGASVIVKLKSQTPLTAEEEVKAEVFADRLTNAWYTAETSRRNGIMEQNLYNDVLDDAKRFAIAYPGLRKYIVEKLGHYSFARSMLVFSSFFEDGET
jgi:hypothetical protein